MEMDNVIDRDKYKALFKAFKTGTIAISVKREDWDLFLDLCDDFGIRWNSGDSTRTFRPLALSPDKEKELEMFRFDDTFLDGLVLNVHDPDRYYYVDFKRR